MNCQAVQNQILDLSDPRELTPALREHVLACAGCREWARRAARLEALVAQLPAPAAPGDKKKRMLAELERGAPLATPAARRGAATEFLRRNLSYVGGLAAAVLVAVGGYALWPSKPPEVAAAKPPQKHPLLDKIVAGNTAMARADSARRRLEVLSGMADDIATDTKGMARIANGAELRQMAGWYDDVVKEGIVRQADKLPIDMPAAEKARLLNELADKLATDAVAADALAKEVPQDAQPALQRMATTAHTAEQSLRKGK